MTPPDTPSGDVTERVDVCICTFRRAERLVAAIASVARQLAPGVSVRVVVADNDDQPSARDVAVAAAASHGLDIRYVHAPAANISIARNACLDAVESDWFAFIDDDETAAPDWLVTLLAAREGVDVVFGSARAVYAPDAPRWMVRGDYHSNIIEGGGPITTGYTSNVLIRRACLGELRFDPALGRAGGEDTMFFYALHLKGALFAAEPDARVFEEVPPSRQSLGWILRRRYRAGQTHAHLTAQFHPRRAPFVAALAMLKVLYCALATLLCVPFPTAHMRNLARGALHVGVVAYSFGGRFHQEYGHGRPDASPLAGERPRG